MSLDTRLSWSRGTPKMVMVICAGVINFSSVIFNGGGKNLLEFMTISRKVGVSITVRAIFSLHCISNFDLFFGLAKLPLFLAHFFSCLAECREVYWRYWECLSARVSVEGDAPRSRPPSRRWRRRSSPPPPPHLPPSSLPSAWALLLRGALHLWVWMKAE